MVYMSYTYRISIVYLMCFIALDYIATPYSLTVYFNKKTHPTCGGWVVLSYSILIVSVQSAL